MIIYVLRIALLLLSFYGLTVIVEKKLSIPRNLSYAITAILITLVLFFAAILNILKYITYLLHIIGIFYLIYDKIKTRKIKFDYKLLIILLFAAYFVILAGGLKLIAYDNFSHWALIVKQLFVNDCLPSFEYNVVDFTTYPPASALFIYYFSLLAGKTETSMIIGQLYFTFILLTPLLLFLKDDKKVASSIIFSLFALFIMNSNSPMDSLLVDTLLGTVGITSCCIAYYYRKDLKKAFMLLTIMSCGVIILKNAGILFVAFNCILLLLVGIHNKKIKAVIKYILLMLVITFSVFFLWQQHLKMVYKGDTGITTKHSISIVNFKRTISKNGIEKSKAVLAKYYGNIKNIKGDKVAHYLIGINIILLICMIISKKYKEHLKIILLIDALYLGYWLCLGVMYVLSMPYDEAIKLACYARYMMSPMIVLFGITFISIFELDLYSGIKYRYCPIVLGILMLFLIYSSPINSYKRLLGLEKRDYSDRERVKEFVKNYPIEEYKGKNFYLYFSCNFSTYYYHMLKYEYFSKNFNYRCNNIDINALNDGTIIITPDNTKDLSNEKGVVKVKDNVYEVKK